MVTGDVNIPNIFDGRLIDGRSQLLLEWPIAVCNFIRHIQSQKWILISVEVPDESVSRVIIKYMVVDFQIIFRSGKSND